MGELGRRWAVAGVGIPIVLALLYLGGWYLSVPLAAFAALGARELYGLAEEGDARPLVAVGAVGAAALVLTATWSTTFGLFAPRALALLAAVAAVSLASSVFVTGLHASALASVSTTLLGAVYVGLALSVVPLLHVLPGTRGWSADATDPWAGLIVLTLPLAATWVGDASAYFVGSAWGRSRLAPAISPNKSWVGFWGALVGAGVAAGLWWAVAHPFLPGFALGVGPVVAIGVALGLSAVVGDLVESVLKREAGVKDSGSFFPGHGGVLDRLDALLFTLPVAYLALSLLGGGA